MLYFTCRVLHSHTYACLSRLYVGNYANDSLKAGDPIYTEVAIEPSERWVFTGLLSRLTCMC